MEGLKNEENKDVICGVYLCPIYSALLNLLHSNYSELESIGTNDEYVHLAEYVKLQQEIQGVFTDAVNTMGRMVTHDPLTRQSEANDFYDRHIDKCPEKTVSDK